MSMLPVAALLLGLIGCTDPLFPEDQPRTPYDRYADLRGESRPAKEMKPTGREGPALRERLAPLD